MVTDPDAPPCAAPDVLGEPCSDAAYVRVLIGSGTMADDGLPVCGRCSRRIWNRHHGRVVIGAL